MKRVAAISLVLGISFLVPRSAFLAPAERGTKNDERRTSQQREPVGRLTPPEALATLEGPDRDEWQQPDRIMDVLEIADGAKVADIGAGGGWFTVRLAHRVGPNGKVFAVDIQQPMIDAINRRVQREGLLNVQTILGKPDDPTLPAGMQAVLIVDAYPQIRNPVALLKNIVKSLAPNGRVGIVDFKKEGSGGPGPAIEERLDPIQIIRDAQNAGLQLRSSESFLRYQYFLVFVR